LASTLLVFLLGGEVDEIMDTTTTTRTAPLVGAAGPHPVQLTLLPRSPSRRVHVAARAILLLALGTLGLSSAYWLCYLVLPALAALVVTQKGSERALAETGPPTVRVLRWLASAYAYLWLLTDVLPTSSEASPVDLRVELGGKPTSSSTLLRLINSVPAVVLLVVLTIVALPVWIVGAAWILAKEHLPDFVHDYLLVTLRYQFRFAAYHLSLVDRYPTLSRD
jgi:hypothetical protein